MSTVTKEALVKKALEKLQETGWKNFSLENLAHAENIPLHEIYCFFSSKEELLSALLQQINQQTLAEAHLEDLPSLKERLFELIACRFECLAPYQSVIQEIYDASILDPCQYLWATQNMKKTLLWMMAVAGCRSQGFSQILFLNTFFSLYVVTFYKWLQDHTQDKAPTLSFLDQSLTRVFPLFQAFEKVF